MPFEEGEIVAKPSKGPRVLVLELTTRCNLNCVMCFRKSWSERLGDMSERTFHRALEGALEAGASFVWFAGWGEPLIHPKFLEWVWEVKELGLGLGINTNGTLLDEELAMELVKAGVDRITISVDAASKEVYRSIRGGDFTAIMKALRAIHNTKRERGSVRPILEFSFTATKDNVHELPRLFDLAEKAGVGRIIVSNVIPTTKPLEDKVLYNGWGGEDWVWDVVSRKSLETNVGARLPEFSLRTERSCAFIKTLTSCITWDGKVAPCYNFLHTYTAYVFGVEKNIKQVSFGSLGKESLTEIWRKPEYVAFRCRTLFFQYPSCADCRLRHYCMFVESSDMDCWGNTPTCADCLYGRGIVQCPL